MMLIVSGTKSLCKKGDKVQDIKASILSRGNRKFWYVKYQVLFEIDDVKTLEESTKVLKTEKTLKYMQTKFLPAWMARKQEELKAKKHINVKFNYFALLFLSDYEKFHDYQNVKYRIEKILSDFSSRDIRKITKLEIKLWLNSLRHKTTNKELSKQTRLKYLRVFHGVYELAVDDNILDKNFTYDIKLTGEKRDLNNIKPFSKGEVNTLLKFSKDSQYGELLHYYLGIAFNQGMSPSEIIGLQVSDIDLLNQTISIKRNITKSNIKDTKTAYRDRVIPIFSTSMTYIMELLKIANKKCSIWLFSGDNGTNLIDIRDIRGNKLLVKDGKILKHSSKWYKLLSDCDIEYRDLKNCRHTFAVSAIESKLFTFQEIASILGHSDLNMLINHYAKWTVGKSLDANKQVDLYGDTMGDTNKNSAKKAS